jgi:membrane peptidoglycan carboxypeptidase
MKKIFRKLLLIIILLIIVVCSILFIIGFSTYSKALKEKPLMERVTNITTSDNFVKYNNLSRYYVNAVIATEDHRYYDHGPVDFIGLFRAIYTNISNGELQEGGSTITQQVAKNVILSQEASISRKLAELFGAYELEKNYTKNEILEIYVNTSYFGDGYYGIYQASHGYYNKEPADLTLSEASMLAGIPNAPSVYAPTVNPDLAKKRQKHVLKAMVEYGYISKQEADSI